MNLITNTICIEHTYFDIINISLPQSKFFSPFIPYAGVGIYSINSSYAGVQYIFVRQNFGKAFLTI